MLTREEHRIDATELLTTFAKALGKRTPEAQALFVSKVRERALENMGPIGRRLTNIDQHVIRIFKRMHAQQALRSIDASMDRGTISATPLEPLTERIPEGGLDWKQALMWGARAGLLTQGPLKPTQVNALAIPEPQESFFTALWERMPTFLPPMAEAAEVTDPFSLDTIEARSREIFQQGRIKSHLEDAMLNGASPEYIVKFSERVGFQGFYDVFKSHNYPDKNASNYRAIIARIVDAHANPLTMFQNHYEWVREHGHCIVDALLERPKAWERLTNAKASWIIETLFSQEPIHVEQLAHVLQKIDAKGLRGIDYISMQHGLPRLAQHYTSNPGKRQAIETIVEKLLETSSNQHLIWDSVQGNALVNPLMRWFTKKYEPGLTLTPIQWEMNAQAMVNRILQTMPESLEIDSFIELVERADIHSFRHRNRVPNNPDDARKYLKLFADRADSLQGMPGTGRLKEMVEMVLDGIIQNPFLKTPSEAEKHEHHNAVDTLCQMAKNQKIPAEKILKFLERCARITPLEHYYDLNFYKDKSPEERTHIASRIYALGTYEFQVNWVLNEWKDVSAAKLEELVNAPGFKDLSVEQLKRLKRQILFARLSETSTSSDTNVRAGVIAPAVIERIIERSLEKGIALTVSETFQAGNHGLLAKYGTNEEIEQLFSGNDSHELIEALKNRAVKFTFSRGEKLEKTLQRIAHYRDDKWLAENIVELMPEIQIADYDFLLQFKHGETAPHMIAKLMAREVREGKEPSIPIERLTMTQLCAVLEQLQLDEETLAKQGKPHPFKDELLARCIARFDEEKRNLGIRSGEGGPLSESEQKAVLYLAREGAVDKLSFSTISKLLGKLTERPHTLPKEVPEQVWKALLQSFAKIAAQGAAVLASPFAAYKAKRSVDKRATEYAVQALSKREWPVEIKDTQERSDEKCVERITERLKYLLRRAKEEEIKSQIRSAPIAQKLCKQDEMLRNLSKLFDAVSLNENIADITKNLAEKMKPFASSSGENSTRILENLIALRFAKMIALQMEASVQDPSKASNGSLLDQVHLIYGGSGDNYRPTPEDIECIRKSECAGGEGEEVNDSEGLLGSVRSYLDRCRPEEIDNHGRSMRHMLGHLGTGMDRCSFETLQTIMKLELLTLCDNHEIALRKEEQGEEKGAAEKGLRLRHVSHRHP